MYLQNKQTQTENKPLITKMEKGWRKDKLRVWSLLAWRIPWTEEPGELQTIGLQKIEHNWSDLACTVESVSNIFYWERDFEMEYKQIILILSWSDRFTPILIN